MAVDLNELTSMIDSIWAIDHQIEGLAAQVEIHKANRRNLELKILASMQEANATIISAHLARAMIKPKIVYNVLSGEAGWPRLYERIQRTGEFDLLHKRLTTTAAKARFDLGDILPGVERKEFPELKVDAL